MKKILLVLSLTGLILLCGCLGTSPQGPPANTTPQATATPAVTIAATDTTPSVTPTTPAPFTDEMVKRHFLNIAFGRDNAYIEKLTVDPDNPVDFSLNGQVSADDVATIKAFAADYNKTTNTRTFSREPIRTDQKGIYLGYFPDVYLKSLSEANIVHKEVDPETDRVLFMVTYSPESGDHLYVNSDLTGDIRTHMTMRALFYYLGFPGQTYDYPDSFFYANSLSNDILTPLDKAAINVMYDARIYRGMTFQSAKNVLLMNP
jgi:hypothetical protein